MCRPVTENRVVNADPRLIEGINAARRSINKGLDPLTRPVGKKLEQFINGKQSLVIAFDKDIDVDAAWGGCLKGTSGL